MVAETLWLWMENQQEQARTVVLLLVLSASFVVWNVPLLFWCSKRYWKIEKDGLCVELWLYLKFVLKLIAVTRFIVYTIYIEGDNVVKG